jgi:CBS domain containing-hemolysin-like protein
MTPRPDIFSFEENQRVGDVSHLVKESGYSRIPVHQGDLDSVVGVLYAKDLINVEDYVSVKDIMRSIFFVSERKKVDSLLRDFKQKQIHIAMVVNEHGTVVGLITIEDLLEEIVGEIYDEMDTPEDNLEGFVRKNKTGSLLVKGKIELDELESVLGIMLDDKTHHNTLSGLIMDKLNRIPETGEELHYGNYIFIVKEMSGHRVDEVEIRKRKS